MAYFLATDCQLDTLVQISGLHHLKNQFVKKIACLFVGLVLIGKSNCQSLNALNSKFMVSPFVNGQGPTTIPFDFLHWNIQAKEITMGDFQGYPCLTLVDGAAYLKDNLENGVVEFDINFEKDRCFPGLMFRIADDKNFEFLYLRPHQSGNPDAIQYCPIFFGLDSWQLYTGDGYCAQKDFAFNAWIHVKVIISGKQAELYLNNEPSPTLFMYHLQREPILGGLALDNHSPAKVRFANFSYSKLSDPPMKSAPKIIPPLGTAVIKRWQVSSGFSEKDLDRKFTLQTDDLNNLTWQTIGSEDLGFINIGKYVIKTTEKNTVFAKFDLESAKKQIKQMALGFSDRCRVYLNGKLLYAGSNTFKSRDYRFYGTIGFWDQLFLDLKKGRNEVVIAVSENFGGWGVEAKFDDLTDLAISKQ